ncbi:MAG: thiamine phosphate synthase, partial [Vampirovibrionia bacterium]
LRVLEEYSKLESYTKSNIFESARYQLYTLEKNMHSKAINLFKSNRLNKCKLYLVTDRSQFTDLDSFYDAVASAISGGVDILQLREKHATAKEFTEIARTLQHICSINDTIFIINDRIDIAQAVKADGVHLGQEDIDIKTARSILGDEAIIGSSTHKPEDAIKAMNNGADYAGVGPVFTTPTKPGRQAVGLEYVKWATENFTIPFFAIGGIDTTNIQEVIDTGASRIAVVRAIINNPAPKTIAKEMKNKLENINCCESKV